MSNFPDTIKDFLDMTTNPKKDFQRRQMWDDFQDGTWFDKADGLTTDSNIRQVLYGVPVYSYLNYYSEVWSLFPKRPAESKLGFRVIQNGGRSSATATTGTYAEGLFQTQTLTSSTKASFGVISYIMKWHNSVFGATERVLWQSERDDALAWWDEQRKHAAAMHIREFDLYLTRNVNWTTRATVIIETIDSMISSSSEATFLPSGSFNSYSGATAANVYRGYGANLRRAGWAGTGYGNGEWDAVVDENAGTIRPLTLSLLDGVIRQVRINGSDLKNFAILTGPDTADQLSDLITSKERYTTKGNMTVGVNGLSRTTQVGVSGGFDVPLYKGVPVLTAVAAWNNRLAEGVAHPAGAATPIWGIDLNDAYISVGMPTFYGETDRSHWALLDRLRRKALLVTAAELVFTRYNRSFKIRDIQA